MIERTHRDFGPRLPRSHDDLRAEQPVADPKPTPDEARAMTYARRRKWTTVPISTAELELRALLAEVRAEAVRGSCEDCQDCAGHREKWKAEGAREEREAVLRWLLDRACGGTMFYAELQRGDHRRKP